MRLERGSTFVWGVAALFLVSAVAIAAGVGPVRPGVADAAVCAPGQVISSGLPPGGFSVVSGKAYFASNANQFTVVDLGTGAQSTVASGGSPVYVDDANQRMFTATFGSPGNPARLSLFDASTDTVVTQAPPIPTGLANSSIWAISSASFDAQRGALFFSAQARSNQVPFGPTGIRLVRYDVAGNAFTVLGPNYNPGLSAPVVGVETATGTVWLLEVPSPPVVGARVLRARDPQTGAQIGPDTVLSASVTGFDPRQFLAVDSGIATLLVDVPGQGYGFATVDLTSRAVTPPNVTWSSPPSEFTDALDRGFISEYRQIREVDTTTGAVTSIAGVPIATSDNPPYFGSVAWREGDGLPLLAVVHNPGPAPDGTLVALPDPVSCAYETTPPSVNHVAPATGASFATGASATLDLNCADTSGIVYCGALVVRPTGEGYVRDGGSLPTDTQGTYRIRDVLAIDRDGNQTERSYLSDPSFDVTYTVAAAPADSTAPSITLTTPGDNAQYSLGQSVTAAYACQDEPGGSGLATCVGSVANGSAIDTASAGSKSFVVNATDTAGNPASLSNSYEVLAGNAAGTYSGGQTVTTDPGGVGASPGVPVQTSLVLPASLGPTNVAIGTQATTAGSGGFAFFGTEVVVGAAGAVVPAASPFVATFKVDKSLLDGPPAVAATDVQIFRDGVLVTGCTDASAAIPDPCVASKSVGPGGDGIYVVRTTHFSTFSFARFAWSLSGLFSPVDNLPTVNAATPGRAIPVKFSLGGNRGLDVFADGYPKSLAYTCETNQPLDAIEETVPDSGSSLTYESSTGRYTYVWKTTKTWTGCRELTLRFRDGSAIRAHFKFK